MRTRLTPALLAALLWPAPVVAQRPAPAADSLQMVRFTAGVSPDTVTVGDRFVAVLRVDAPAGSRVRFTGLPVGDTLQPVDSLRVLPAESGAAVAYRLVAWAAGAPLRARVPVVVVLPDGRERSYRVPLPLPVARSVLPADTTGLSPRAARGVIPLPARRFPWAWLVLGVLVVAGFAAWLLARSRRRAVAPDRNPREEALAALAELVAAAPDPDRAYGAGTRVLRRYLGALDPEWGEHWTTDELLQRLRLGAAPERAVGEIGSLLHDADRVKFAGDPATAARAAEFLEGARRWVRSYPPAPAEPSREAA